MKTIPVRTFSLVACLALGAFLGSGCSGGGTTPDAGEEDGDDAASGTDQGADPGGDDATTGPDTGTGDAIVANHAAAGSFGDIPQSWLDQAKANLRLAYGHTSHGSQIVTGIEMLQTEDQAKYGFTTGSDGFLCDTCIDGASDLGNPDRTSWVAATRNYLNGAGSGRNVIMWSWCGQAGTATEAEIANDYLANLAALESEFPAVTFIYMTGHLDGTGEAGNLKQRNQQIRDYATTHHKVLFDFADIESWDPAGTYLPDESDACDWCTAWCAGHTCPACDSCAHSHCFNCYQKGKAFWWLMARLAGWQG